ncbi:MAG: hypothetical protein ACR2FO_04960 [Actinomycetota bacterium]
MAVLLRLEELCAKGCLDHESIHSLPVWKEVAARFQTTNDQGPRGYAEEAQRADPGADYARLRQDAVGAIQEFLAALAE